MLSRRVLPAALVLLAVLALLDLGPIGSTSGPGGLLQSVDVRLASDGSISAVDVADITQHKGTLTSTSRKADPAAVAGALPVSVAVSYLKDGHPGTDLADLKGAKGLVEVDVTVTNTTVHPQLLHYTSGGQDHSAWAQVGTPLTVVGSATLPRGSVARVVQPPGGVPTAHTTNGVVSLPDKGNGSVQWAAMLAPPRLSPTTTFTLVEDASSFAVPDLSFSVRPGLVTDPSVASLLDSAFDGPQSASAVENSTIGLIADVTATMAQATDSLQAVRDDLRTNAQVVGASATASLGQTATDLNGAADALLSSLSSLKSSLSGTLTTAGDASTSALKESLQSLIDAFGVTPGAGDPVPAPTATNRCGAVPADDGSAPSLVGQLRSVAGQIKALAGASGQCVDDLRTSLDTAIGDITKTCPPSVAPTSPSTPATPATPVSLVCRLEGAGSKLDAVAQDIVSRGSHILGEFDPNATTSVSAALAATVTSVKTLQTAAANLVPSASGSPVAALATALGTLDTALADAVDRTDPAQGGALPAAVADLHSTAVTQVANLASSGSPGGSSVADQLRTLAAAICTTPADLPVVDGAYVNSLHRMVDGTDCPATAAAGVLPGLPSFTTPLASRVAADVTAWQQIAAATDTSSASPSGLVAALTAVHSRLVAAQQSSAQALALLGSGNTNGLPSALTALQQALDALYSPARDPQGACPTNASSGGSGTPATPDGSLNDVQRTFTALACNQATVGADLFQLLDKDTPAYLGAATDVHDSAVASDHARTAADDQLGTLLTGLVQRLDSTADRQVAEGAAALGKQQNQLQTAQTKAVAQLDAATKTALQTLGDGVNASTQQQTAAGTLLQGELSKVLVDLGSAAAGKGLLGDIAARAGQTDVRATQVADAADTAQQFRGVRLNDLAAQLMSQQQFSAALRRVQSFPAFPGSPAGSSSTTPVFVYRLAPL